ncbi:hypothetical protein Hanom_Chr02g00157851 [Helianthus anomalus]
MFIISPNWLQEFTTSIVFGLYSLLISPSHVWPHTRMPQSEIGFEAIFFRHVYREGNHGTKSPLT